MSSSDIPRAPALAALLAACAGPTAGSTVYVGEAADRDGPVSIALAVQEEDVAAYACGDDPVAEGYPGWMTGDRAPDESVRIERDGWSVVASVDADRAEGVLVEEGGEELAFTAMRASGDDLTGVYVARDAGCLTGVIVIDGDRDPVVRGAWCNADGEVRQVTPLDPLEMADGRLAVAVRLDTGAHRLAVAPVDDLPLAPRW